MKLTIVGCAGSYPNPDTAASCYLVEHEGTRIAVDFGSGAIGPMQQYVDPRSLDAVFLSHLHADHFLDICALYVVRRYHPQGVAPLLPVYGPDDTSTRIAAAYGMDGDERVSDVYDVRGYDAPVHLGPFTVSARRVHHPVTAFALRIEAGGRVLTFSGDTAPCDALVAAAKDADVALFEASFRDEDDNPPALHMTARQAGRMAAAAGAGRLVLTHLVAWHDNSTVAAEAAGEFGGEVLVAAPGMTLDI